MPYGKLNFQNLEGGEFVDHANKLLAESLAQLNDHYVQYGSRRSAKVKLTLSVEVGYTYRRDVDTHTWHTKVDSKVTPPKAPSLIRGVSYDGGGDFSVESSRRALPDTQARLPFTEQPEQDGELEVSVDKETGEVDEEYSLDQQ